jgi:hypothetical protein
MIFAQGRAETAKGGAAKPKGRTALRPRKPFRSPRFRHLDEEDWREVLAQDHGGKRVSAWEKWLEFGPRMIAFVGRWDPGMIVAQHGHMCINTIFIAEGSMMCGDVLCTKGMNITLDVGTPYGPNIAGPEGVTVYEVMGGDTHVWYADPEGFAVLKRERGVKQLPNPVLPGTGESRASYDEDGMLKGELMPRPEKPYPKPRFRHMDEEPWREVLAQDHGGRRVTVQEKWLDFTPRVMAFVGRWDPGMIVEQHGHMCINTIFVLEGSMMSGDVLCTKGMHITLDIGTPYGPNIAGPEGVTLYEVMLGDPRPWHADPEGFAALKRERGVTQLSTPPLDLPAWAKTGH